MVTMDSVEKQLKKLEFNYHGWGRSEIKELPHILLPDEEIYEVVNGFYEAGFALLVATDVRLLLIDRKPMNYLTVEDLRFDMINEIDYSHRLLGANISVSAGAKNLKFTSINQPRLRKLITHVQHCMAEAKKKQDVHQVDQKQHLEQINQQLQSYLLAQQQQQQKLTEELQRAQQTGEPVAVKPEPVKPSPELADYLLAQNLMAQHKAGLQSSQAQPTVQTESNGETSPIGTIPLPPAPASVIDPARKSQIEELYAEGMQEIFGKHPKETHQATTASPVTPANPAAVGASHSPLEINPLRVAYSKLPMALRNRKFGRPSFHAHSQQLDAPSKQQTAPAQ